MTKNAIVVDDNSANRDFLERLISTAGFNVASFGVASDAMKYCADCELSLALLDMELPDTNGIQLTAKVREKFPNCYIVVATMHDDHHLVRKVQEKGGNAFLVKPHGFMELYKRLSTTDMKQLHEEPFMVIDQYGPRALSTAR